MVDLIYTDRSEADGCGHTVAEDGGSSVALVGVDEHSRNDAVSVEGLAVGGMCVGLAGIRGGVVPAVLGQLLLCEIFELAGLWVALVKRVGVGERMRLVGLKGKGA